MGSTKQEIFMKTVLMSLMFAALSPALANANCLINDYDEKVCEGDTTHPWKQKIVTVDEDKGMVLLQESNGSYTALTVGHIRVQPREKYGYRVGQVISNPQVSLQIVDIDYDASINPDLLKDVSPTNRADLSASFRNTQQLRRTLSKAANIQEHNRQEQDASDEGYRFLGRTLIPGDLTISEEQLNSIKSLFAGSDTDVRVSTLPFNVRIVSIDPAVPTLLVSYEMNGATRKMHMLKSELDLFSAVQTREDFQSGCSKISVCSLNLKWGKR
jgi:hypothetical protein